MVNTFIDTGGLIALFHHPDRLHDLAKMWLTKLQIENSQWITTSAVLTEVLDGFAQHGLRHYSVALSEFLKRTSIVEVIIVDISLLEKGWDLYESRADKEWGLTDCISFVVMRERNVTNALAHDIHLAQAGFRPLLREQP
jgi:predicted nucleic acid-binding protein